VLLKTNFIDSILFPHAPTPLFDCPPLRSYLLLTMLVLLHSRVSCSPLPHARPHLYNLSLRTSNGVRGTNGPARSGIRPWILVGLDKGKGYCDLEPLDCDRDIYYKTLEIPRASLRNVWKAASQKICCPVRVLTLCGAASTYQTPMGARGGKGL